MSSIDPTLELALRQFAAQSPLLIALDFDGTLAPLIIDPEQSRMIPEARSALDALTGFPNVHIALVTGRAIESIVRVAEPHPSWFLVGSHGIELVTPENQATYRTPHVVPKELIAVFEDIVARFEGTRIETKPFGVALHTRGVEHTLARAAEQAAHAFCQEWGGDLVVRTGHGIVECATQVASKGDGMKALVGHISPAATLFAGDDVTDEDGFAVLGATDLAIRVGGGDTKAPYRLENAHAVADALWLLRRFLVRG